MLLDSIYPQRFSAARISDAVSPYFSDPSAVKLAEFFEAKGLPALKEEDQREKWYDDWLAYQATHRLYASLLAPKEFSKLGAEFDLLKYARFLEVFAYYSPSHGYSLQVTFLGLFAILMGANRALKEEAIAALEAGGLMGLGVSEKDHGSDLLANEFNLTATAPGEFTANGSKYYIGNSNCAAMISILARKEDRSAPAGRIRRLPFVIFALRPRQAKGFRSVRKIRTLGVRSAFVGEFEVKDQPVPQSDIVAEGRGAWDAVFGAVTLGKFFLGFGSIGICERAFEEAAAHVKSRILYGLPVIEMPHIALAMAHAYARLTAMKLYAYRALDYIQASSAADRRYLLYCAVQKAKVSTEGVKIMSQLSECMGARGFESDTYFEMALRDAQLIPGLEGSTHVNLALTAQFAAQYFTGKGDSNLATPQSLAAAQTSSRENPYLFEARASAIHTVMFDHFLKAYHPLAAIANVHLFARQAKAFQLLLRKERPKHGPKTGTHIELMLGQCVATIAYAQLIAENAGSFNIPTQIISVIFHLLINDLSAAAMSLASAPRLDAAIQLAARRMIAIPQTTFEEWDFISNRIKGAAAA